MLKNPDVNIGYELWGERYVAEGWSPYLLTFMFKQLGGSPVAVARQMEREVERVYATLLPRIVRRPTAPSAMGRLPVWLCSHDWPVFKREKSSLRDVVVNDGQHVHAACFVPPWSRLREDLAAHVEEHRDLYIRSGFPLLRLDVEPVTQQVGYVVGYARKHASRAIVGEDVSFVLPRSATEIRDSQPKKADRGVTPR